MKIYARAEIYEPPYKTKHWGSEVIVLTSDPTNGVEVCASTHIHDNGIEDIKNGKKIIFFKRDISFRQLLQELINAGVY